MFGQTLKNLTGSGSSGSGSGSGGSNSKIKASSYMSTSRYQLPKRYRRKSEL